MNRRVLPYAVIVLVLAGGWFFAMYEPYRRQQAETRGRAAEARRQLAQYGRFMAELPTILAARKELEARKLDLNSHLYARNELIMLFEHLEQDAAQYGLRVEEITPPIEELLELNRAGLKSNGPRFLNIDVRLTGPFAGLGKFVQQLESERHFSTVRRCLITSSGDRRTNPQMLIGFTTLLGSGGAS